VLKDIIFATSIVNPSRRISYNLLGERGSLGSAEGVKPLRRETSVLWYTEKQFLSLLKDFVTDKPEIKLKEFISLFRGFTSKKVVREILQELTTIVNMIRKRMKVCSFYPPRQLKTSP
jgi:hypothetical protein